MIEDIRTVMWKEWLELRTYFSGRGKVSLLFFLAVFSVFMPLQFGPDWPMTPVPPVAALWMALFLVTPVVADAFAGERERRTLETLLATRLPDAAIYLGKILTAVGYGVSLAWVGMLLALVTVNGVYGPLRLYPFDTALATLVFTPLVAGVAACAGTLVSLRAASVREAQQTLSIANMLLLFVPLFGFQALPDAWQLRLIRALRSVDASQAAVGAAVVLALANGVLIYWISRRFRRDMVILD